MRSVFSLSLLAALFLAVGHSACSSEASQLPVTNGLALWLDASQLAGMTDGQQVNTWTDSSGLGNNAIRQSGSSVGYPMYVADGVNGKPVVRFNSRTLNTGDYFRFNRISNIRTVFWVVKEKSGASDSAFLLGDQSTYHFHRSSANGPIWSNTYASANVKNGTTMLMGTPVNGTTSAIPADQFQVLSVVTTGIVQANQLCQDRVYHGSWQGDIAEIIIYTTALSASEEAAVGKYPATKYGLSTAYMVAPTVTATTPANGGVVDSATPSVSVTFSKLMNRASVEAAFTMGDVAGTFSWSGNTLTFNPSLRLHPNTTYTVSIGMGAQAFDGTSLAAPYSFVVSTPSGLNGSALTVTCDNAYELYLNGILVGSGNTWTSAQKYSNIALVPGKNVIAVKGMDTGGVAALLAEMTVGSRRVGTSSNCKVALTPPANWTDQTLDDSSWTSATEYGAYGVTPWNTSVSNMPTDTPARWIWSSNNNADNTVYLRWTIDTSAVSSAPTNLVFSHVSDRVVEITWQAAVGANPFDYYEVYRNGAFVAVVGTPGYRDTTLSPLTQYSYTVRSVNALGGTSPFSAPAVVTTLSAPPVGTGTGLQGKYYATTDFNNRLLVRTDAQVAFDWGNGAPATGVGADNFSVRWEGQIQPQYSEQYTFYTLSDDGVRLWVDGQPLISNWTDHSTTENQGQITLQAGQKYDIRVDYYEHGGQAVAKLLWESRSQPKELVPTSQLYPAVLAEINLLTSAESAVSPVWVEGRNISDAVSVKFSVNGGAAQDVVRESAIQWYADTASAQGLPYGIPLDKDAPTALSVTSLAASTQAYYYRLRATNGAGDSIYSNEATATGQVAAALSPVGPPGYIYCAAENQTFTLPGTCDVAYGANGKFNYLTGRSGAITFNNATFGDPIVGTAKAGFYKPAADLPAAPSNLCATVVSGNQINLTWTDNASNETGFKLERKLGATGTWAQIATLDADTANYGDTANGCGSTQTQSYSLAWTPTKLNGKSWSKDEVVIRVNDSLLFTVESTVPNIEVTLDTNEDGRIDYRGPANMKFPWKYTTPGHYTVTAWLGTEECGTLTVTVMDANLHAPIACEVGYQREKFIEVTPLDSMEKLSFVGNDPALLGVSIKGPAVDEGILGLKLYMTAVKRGTPILQARVNGKCGPLVKQQEVDEFTLELPGAAHLASFSLDGGSIGTSKVVIRPFIQNLEFQAHMFAHRSTFTGGQTLLLVNSSDFTRTIDETTGEEIGTHLFEIESPTGEQSYCVGIALYQSSSERIQVSGNHNVNGNNCVWSVEPQTMILGTKKGLTVTLVTAGQPPKDDHLFTVKQDHPPIVANGKQSCAGPVPKVVELSVDASTQNGCYPGHFKLWLDDTPTPETVVTVVKVVSCSASPAAIAVQKGSTSNASALVLPPDRQLTWSIVGNNRNCTIDQTGKVETGDQTTAGDITIHVADAEIPDSFAEAKLTLVRVFNCAVKPTSIAANGRATAQASAEVEPSGRKVLWSISSTDNLGCTIDPQSGVVTAGSTPGTITVRATDSEVYTAYAEATLVLYGFGGVFEILADTNRSGDINADDIPGKSSPFTKDRGAYIFWNGDHDCLQILPDVYEREGQLGDSERVKVRITKAWVDSDYPNAKLFLKRSRPEVRVTLDRSAAVRSILLGPNTENEICLSDEVLQKDYFPGAYNYVNVDATMVPRNLVEWDGSLDLILELRLGATVLCSDVVRLQLAPVVFSTNVDTAEKVFASDGGPIGVLPNLANQIRAAAPGLSVHSESTYVNYFLQDAMECGNTYDPIDETKRMVAAVDLKHPGLTQWPSDMAQKYNYALTSVDNEGNGGDIECIPPHEGYPLARIIHRSGSGFTFEVL